MIMYTAKRFHIAHLSELINTGMFGLRGVCVCVISRLFWLHAEVKGGGWLPRLYRSLSEQVLSPLEPPRFFFLLLLLVRLFACDTKQIHSPLFPYFIFQRWQCTGSYIDLLGSCRGSVMQVKEIAPKKISQLVTFLQLIHSVM